MHIAIVIFDGFDNLDAIGPFEVFNHARLFGADVDVGLYSPFPQELVESSHGLRIQPDGFLVAEADQKSPRTGPSPGALAAVPALVLVPGGGWDNHDVEGTWVQVQRGDLGAAIADLHDDGAMVASVCTGGMILAHAGLTDGRPAVTHRSALDDLRQAGAEVVEARVVDDDDLLTAGGVTAGIDLALHFVEREFGPDVVERVATEMEHEPRGEVYDVSLQ